MSIDDAHLNSNGDDLPVTRGCAIEMALQPLLRRESFRSHDVRTRGKCTSELAGPLFCALSMYVSPADIPVSVIGIRAHPPACDSVDWKLLSLDIRTQPVLPLPDNHRSFSRTLRTLDELSAYMRLGFFNENISSIRLHGNLH